MAPSERLLEPFLTHLNRSQLFRRRLNNYPMQSLPNAKPTPCPRRGLSRWRRARDMTRKRAAQFAETDCPRNGTFRAMHAQPNERKASTEALKKHTRWRQVQVRAKRKQSKKPTESKTNIVPLKKRLRWHHAWIRTKTKQTRWPTQPKADTMPSLREAMVALCAR